MFPVFINGLTSIAYAADCYLALTRSDQIVAQSLVNQYKPYRWLGWRVVIEAASIRRRAFLKAIKVGTLSDNRQADNYYGHYFHTHYEGGRDYFRDRRTFVYISSPFSKAQIDKHASEMIARRMKEYKE